LVVSQVEEDKKLTNDIVAADVSATFTLSTVASRYR